jgi:MoxR-like ATPase
MTQPGFNSYHGDGKRRLQESPLFQPIGNLRDPSGYEAGAELRDAVNVAVRLGMPLLVTGEPGTGKTELAHSVAWELGLPGPLVFNAKTTSTAQDLFYRYDALRHFHASRFRESADIEEFIDLEPLGKAIVLAMPREDADSLLTRGAQDAQWLGRAPLRAVVLIDEIDKAPRDLPNDILNEIEDMAFTIKETGKRLPANGDRSDNPFRPIIIMTSNSEKNLPEAFLRRCVYYNIPFPEKLEELERIVHRRLPLSPQFTPQRLTRALTLFSDVRDAGLARKPATAELLSWMRLLNDSPSDLELLDAGRRDSLGRTYALLVKNREDRQRLYQALGIVEQR